MTDKKTQLIVLLAVLAGFSTAALSADDPLRAGFADPPQPARPRTWWHWMNGNITEDGITKDLEWMKRVGLGGVQSFDANLATPQVVEHRLVYMTPEWQHAFQLAVHLAGTGRVWIRHCQLRWLERDRRALVSPRRHEEAGVERDARARRSSFQGPARRLRLPSAALSSDRECG